jgi:hypothetical protein
MVKFPNVLSVQVLPQYLRALAIQRLDFVKERVPTFKYVKENPILKDITIGQIDGIINFINASDQSHLWQDCIEFNHRLDKTRNQCFEEVTPEFKRYV